MLLLERQGLQTLWEVARLAAVTSILLFMNSVGADPAHSLLALSVVQVLIYGTLLMLILKAAVAHDAKRATQLEPGALGQSISVE